MSPTKILIGQIFSALAIVLLGLWIATQWTARRLGYQPQLGPAAFDLLGLPIYRPWSLLAWWYHFDAYAPKIFDRAGEIAGTSGILACATAVAGSLWRARQHKHVTTYGSARWAGFRDAENAGLFDASGVFLGSYGEHNAILDNCHVRIAFASNDERTAKRISDALGTATEQRAMRNYAGHRLAPWLNHVMVSRQETARALLTPGEVMQLPATEELVLVSGLPPIRAAKLRYYEDRVFADRVLPAPTLRDGTYTDRPAARDNDWENAARAPDQRLLRHEAETSKTDDGGLEQQRTPGSPEQPQAVESEPTMEAAIASDDHDSDPAVDAKPMEQARSAALACSTFTMDETGPRQGVLGLDF